MISGAHAIIYSSDPAADRAFFRDVLGLKYVDVGDGWLIFALPPSEVAFHPAEQNGRHEFYLLCDDIAATRAALAAKGVDTSPEQDEGWGLLTTLTLPGGGPLAIYQPRHARPEPPTA